jgi:hypothetical protein
MKNLTLKQIQDNLKQWMGEEIKPLTRTGILLERTYIKALLDTGATVPPICIILLQSGRSIVNFK